MIPGLSLLALAGVATASWEEPRQLMHHAMNKPIFSFKRDLESRDAHPCKILSEAYKAAGGQPGDVTLVKVKPSIGIACLKSVPLDKKRNLALLEYIGPLVQFQSTLEVLANPPETYLFAGIDVLGGLEVIKKKLQGDKYESQYDFMTDLRSIFAASHDNHFDYPPALLNLIQIFRPELNMLSLSRDGTHTPEVFMTIDVARANHGTLDYYPSAISSIDGVPVNQWLENDALYNVANYQDPDAQFNGLFTTIQRYATGAVGSSTYSSWETPDNYTIKFRNRSSIVIENSIAFLPTADFSKIETGEDVHNAFEIPSSSDSKNKEKFKMRRSSSQSKGPIGYPDPIVKHSLGSIAGYFLEGDEYKDTAVLSILSFLPVGQTPAQIANLNYTEFILEGRRVIVDFFEKAQKEGRDKLIIDLSANGGGVIFLAYEVYRLIFPHGEFSAFDRMRAHEALEVLAEADFDTLNDNLITETDSYPVNTDGEHIKSSNKWFGPDIAGKQNVTVPYLDDVRVPWDPAVPAYFNGENEKYTVIHNAVFKPENMLIITDGTCASACGIFTGLLTRNQKIRTVALGGRPLYQAMQAMGGVRGSRLNYFGEVISATTEVASSVKKKNNKEAFKALVAASDILPNPDPAPLLPLIEDNAGGRLNSLNAYPLDDLDGYPLHFQYEAANCRLFYTQLMTKDVTEQWRHAYAVGWKNATCVKGSTSNSDNTIGSETVKYDSRVRSHAPPMANPGALS